MKQLLIFPVLLLLLTLSFMGFRSMNSSPETSLVGAWEWMPEEGDEMDEIRIRIFSPTYTMGTAYNSETKEFIGSDGGPYTFDGKQSTFTIDYSTGDSSMVGMSISTSIRFEADVAFITMGEGENTISQMWRRLDAGDTPLSGHWQIRARERNGEMQAIQVNGGPRKTIKILSGTRFQWTAMNTATKEFRGCGGGRYTFEDGKYTEHIEYFSRDNSRVGMSLSFDGKVAGDDWYHSGKSSKGAPISEIWARQ